MYESLTPSLEEIDHENINHVWDVSDSAVELEIAQFNAHELNEGHSPEAIAYAAFADAEARLAFKKFLTKHMNDLHQIALEDNAVHDYENGNYDNLQLDTVELRSGVFGTIDEITGAVVTVGSKDN